MSALSWLRLASLSLLRSRDFHRIYHQAGKCGMAWGTTTWKGLPCAQCPLDLWVIGELLWKLNPRWLVETGSGGGGSAAFYQSIFNELGRGNVISVDVKPVKPVADVTFLRSNTLEVIGQIRDRVHGDHTMVILDSTHNVGHVTKELNCYGPLVSVGQYLIVCDTHFNGHPIAPSYGPGPWEALHDWLRAHPEFLIDRSQERHLLTFNPDGFLRRV